MARTLPLPAILDLRTVDLTRDVLATAVEQGGVSIDASQVERMSTVGIQLLLSAAHSAEQRDVPFAIHSPNKVFLDTIKALGLQDHFNTWMTE